MLEDEYVYLCGVPVDKNITSIDALLAYLKSANDMVFLGHIISNWYDVALFRVGLKNSVDIRFRSGEVVTVSSLEDYSNFYNSRKFQEQLLKAKGLKFQFNVDSKHLTFKYRGKSVKFCLDGGRISTMLPQIVEQFVEDQYADLAVSGKDVVDIGTNIGDTAVYFGLRGAKTVYAFEPFKHSYLLAKQNVAANLLSKNIVLVNEGCGKDGYVKLDQRLNDTVSASITGKNIGTKVRINSLKTIVERYGIKDAVLKMDCEGCEYAAILSADRETLNAFSEMSIEYHYGYLNLKHKLESAGFDVECSIPRYLGAHPNAMGDRMFIGLIHAVRNKGT